MSNVFNIIVNYSTYGNSQKNDTDTLNSNENATLVLRKHSPQHLLSAMRPPSHVVPAGGTFLD